MLNKIITLAFYSLFFLTPLFFLPLNSELFEFNKMILVYALTTIITGVWLIKMIGQKQLFFKRTPLDIPLALFLLSQILSTIFSIDPHTSLFGYYSRSNGGLLSSISYILLYYALVSNFNFAQALNFLKALLLGGLVVSLYAIPEHFGVSPSCVILQHSFNADCWVQDVQARVFATLGQPNWLAAYLVMLIFPSFYFVLTSQKKIKKINYFYAFFAIFYYLAFTFTYSRGATLGLIVGMAIFILFLAIKSKFIISDYVKRALIFIIPPGKNFLTSLKGELPLAYPKFILSLLVIFLGLNLFFGSAISGEFRLFKKGAPPARPTISQSSGGSQLEVGGTESGQIRLIVWKGAIEIFKHYPLLGSGVETFAYSYYNFRPVEHNMVSEWDFLYNKAHNEYLNYLATTGSVGLFSYLFLIFCFILWCLVRIFSLKWNLANQIFLSQTTTSKHLDINQQLLILSILCSIIAYLIQDFFGFSVVIVALLFFVLPGFAFLAADELKYLTNKTLSFLNNQFLVMILSLLIGFLTFFTLVTIVKFWRADTFYKLGQDYSTTNSGKAYNFFSNASSLNSNEPLYHTELGNSAASSAIDLAEQDATLSAMLKDKAINETQTALNISPKNNSIWRTAVLTYYTLSLIDPTFRQKSINTINQAIELAPTDPKLYYNKALILEQFKNFDPAIQSLEKAISLKPNYDDALFKLAELYQKQNQNDNSKKIYQQILKYFPNESRALDKLQYLATASAKVK